MILADCDSLAKLFCTHLVESPTPALKGSTIVTFHIERWLPYAEEYGYDILLFKGGSPLRIMPQKKLNEPTVITVDLLNSLIDQKPAKILMRGWYKKHQFS